MAYKRTVWKDRVVERPRTYMQVTNADGSVTQTHAPGEVIEPGTPQNATNFNNLEEALQHTSIAYDMLMTISQAQVRDLEKRLTTAEAQLAALSAP